MSRKKKPEVSNINPAHYRRGGLEVIDILEKKLTPEEFKGMCKGFAIKYILRADDKNGLEDYKKAQWYINKLVAVIEKIEKQGGVIWHDAKLDTERGVDLATVLRGMNNEKDS